MSRAVGPIYPEVARASLSHGEPTKGRAHGERKQLTRNNNNNWAQDARFWPLIIKGWRHATTYYDADALETVKSALRAGKVKKTCTFQSSVLILVSSAPRYR